MSGKQIPGFVSPNTTTVSNSRKPKKAKEQRRVPVRNFLTACVLGSIIDPFDSVDRKDRPLIAHPDISTCAMLTVSIVSFFAVGRRPPKAK